MLDSALSPTTFMIKLLMIIYKYFFLKLDKSIEIFTFIRKSNRQLSIFRAYFFGFNLRSQLTSIG